MTRTILVAVLCAVTIAVLLAANVPVFINSTTNQSGSPAFGSQWWAQTWTCEFPHRITGCGLRLATLAFPGAWAELSLRATDADGRPTGEDLAFASRFVGYGTGNLFAETRFDYPLICRTGERVAGVLRAPSASSFLPVSWITTFSEDIYPGGELFISRDAGASWTRLNEPPDNLKSGEDGFFYEIITAKK